jgi:hypothetical protein
VKRVLVFLLGLGLGALAVAALPLRGEQVLMDSMRQLPPRLRARWLNARGIEIPGTNAPQPVTSESTGLRLVGKYGRGPSVEVTGRDSLVFLSLGSEVAIINFADTANPRVLSEVQAMGLVAQAALRDSFLYIGCNSGQAGIEVWNVQDPAAPVFRSRTPTLLSDFCVRDTLLYLTQSLSGPNDTFKVYSIASPTNVYLLGSCRDSGDAVTATNNAAFLADRWGLYSIDVSDPRNPHQVGTYPGMPISVEARGNICCVTFGNPNDPEWLEFDVLDVTDPASMQRLGYLSDAGGNDMMLDGALAFLSGYFQGTHEFKIVSLADSTHPVAIGQCATPGMNFGVWSDAAREEAFIADRTEGLAVIDIHNLSAPIYEEAHMVAGVAEDFSVDGGFCYVASLDAGMKILDVTAPSLPMEVGALDSLSTGLATFSAVARDSFAYVCWWPQPYLRVANVADPANPRIVAGVSVFDFPQDMVLRDSFLYIAQSYRFQIVNVARPRSPVLIGTCVLPEMMDEYGMDVRDTLAFVANGLVGLHVISIARPDSPRIVGELTPPNGAIDVAVIDTFAYVVSGNLYIASVADPTSPYLIDSVVLPSFGATVAASDSLLFVGSWHVAASRTEIRLFDTRNPIEPVSVGSLPAPDYVTRLVWVEPHLFAACADAGVLVAETAAVGMQEPRNVTVIPDELMVLPNPAGGLARLRFGKSLDSGERLSLYNVTGRRVLTKQIRKEVTSIDLRLTELSPGLYFVLVETKTGVLSSKLVKR